MVTRKLPVLACLLLAAASFSIGFAKGCSPEVREVGGGTARKANVRGYDSGAAH